MRFGCRSGERRNPAVAGFVTELQSVVAAMDSLAEAAPAPG
ncbi:hypothetical protein LJR009_005926 [Bosea sp. LjRoot9]